MVGLIDGEVGTSARTNDEYEEFLYAPLGLDGCRYVLKTDIAAFYQYIDHERLVDEIVAQTGDDMPAVLAISIIQQATGRRFGLPQMTKPSDVLAEVYIEPMRRAMGREGYSVFRFADDFRVACSSYGEALSALESAEREALSLGLVLNEAKTTTPGREKYKRSLEEARSAESELFASVEAEGEEFDVADAFYGDPDDEDGEVATSFGIDSAGVVDDEVDAIDEAIGDAADQSQVAAARIVVDRWEPAEDDFTGPFWSPRVRSILLRKSLQTLGRAADPYALSEVTGILVSQPHLTPLVCTYMRSLAPVYPDDVLATLNKVCRRDISSVWQSVWISYCIGEVFGHISRRTGRTLTEWLRGHLRSRHPALAAEAALALARRRSIKTGEINEILLSVPPVHRSTLIVALGVAATDSDAPMGDDLVERWQFNWGREHLQ